MRKNAPMIWSRDEACLVRHASLTCLKPIWSVLFMMALAACSAAPQAEIAIPTLMVLPSVTPLAALMPGEPDEAAVESALPTSTDLPPATPVIEAAAPVEAIAQMPTLMALPSLTPTATPTLTPTATLTLTATFTPSVTPTTDIPPTAPPPTAETAAQSVPQVANALALFSGTGSQTVGPLSLPEGNFAARLTTTGTFTALLELESGECGAGSLTFLSPMIFSIFEGDAANGLETVLTSNTCTARIQVNDASAPWTLAFYPVR